MRLREGRWSAVWALGAVLVLTSTLLVGTACTAGSSTEVPAPKRSPSAPEEGTLMFSISSPAFEDGGLIPVEYANVGYPGGQNVSIPYEWRGAPEGTVSYALLLIDRHPVAKSFVHWLVTSIPGTASSLPRGASETAAMPPGAVEHVNSGGSVGYGGPRPPAGTGKHQYEAVLYALDTESIALGQRATLADLDRALDGHVLATASYSGLLGR